MSIIEKLKFARILNELGNLSKDEWKAFVFGWNNSSLEEQDEITLMSNYLEKNHATK